MSFKVGKCCRARLAAGDMTRAHCLLVPKAMNTLEPTEFPLLLSLCLIFQLSAPKERAHSTHGNRGLVGPRAGLDALEPELAWTLWRISWASNYDISVIVLVFFCGCGLFKPQHSSNSYLLTNSMEQSPS